MKSISLGVAMILMLTCSFAGALLAQNTSPDITSVDTSQLNYQRNRDLELERLRLDHALRMQELKQVQLSPANEVIIVISINLILCTAVGFIVWVLRSAKNRERMAVIERGVSSEEIRALFGNYQSPESAPLKALKVGLLLTGGGMGYLAVVSTQLFQHTGDYVMLLIAATLFGGGVGLVTYYLIASRIQKKQSKELMKPIE